MNKCLLVGLQPTKTRAELDFALSRALTLAVKQARPQWRESTWLGESWTRRRSSIFGTNVLRVSPDKMFTRFSYSRT